MHTGNTSMPNILF